MRGRIGFELESQRVDLLRFLRRHGPHEEPAVRLRDHEPILLQPRQCLAQRDLAHPQFRGERVLADGQIRLDRAGKDEIPQHVDQAVRQRANLEMDVIHHAPQAT